MRIMERVGSRQQRVAITDTPVDPMRCIDHIVPGYAAVIAESNTRLPPEGEEGAHGEVLAAAGTPPPPPPQRMNT